MNTAYSIGMALPGDTGTITNSTADMSSVDMAEYSPDIAKKTDSESTEEQLSDQSSMQKFALRYASNVNFTSSPASSPSRLKRTLS